MKRTLKEYYELATNKLPLKTKSGKEFKLIYVDPNKSTDDSFANKELMKKYGMEYLPYDKYLRNMRGIPKAWGWVIWNNENDENFPLTRKFGEEIGSQETPPEGGKQRTIDEVLKSIGQLKDVIMQAEESAKSIRVNGKGIIANAEEFKKKLVQGMGSKETMNALAELIRFRTEMSRHRGHTLSFLNTILIFMQKRNATDVRSKTTWSEMGYMPKPNATPIILSMPKNIIRLKGAQYDEAVRRFLEREGVNTINDLTPSQKHRLDIATSYPDPRGGFKPYTAYDISDLIKGEGAEEFPKNTLKWYDDETDGTRKEIILMNACMRFGKSIGVKKYSFASSDELGGSRGTASINGNVKLIDSKWNHSLLGTAVHETAHEIMHWPVVKQATPKLKKFYRGGSALRGTTIVEQEADLCTWLVLSGFRYENQQEHFNYLMSWDLNIYNCCDVFDSILKVADFIYEGIMKQLNKQ